MRVVSWLGHFLGLAALVALPWLAHRAARPEPFKLRIVQGADAAWTGESKHLYLADADPAGRYVFGSLSSENQRGSVWQFDLQNYQFAAKIEVEPTEDESSRDYCRVSATGPNVAIVHWDRYPQNSNSSLDWHSTFVRRSLFAWSLQGTRPPPQIWRWDYHNQGLKLLNVGSSRIHGLKKQSPDGKWWIILAENNSKCCLHDGRTGLVKWQQPIHPIGPRGGSRSETQLIWLPDSRSFLVFDDKEVRWFDVDSPTIRWRRSHAEFARELLGSRAGSFKDWLDDCCVVPRALPMYDSEHGIVRLPIVIVENADKKLNHRPDEAVAFLWELPTNKWTPLGDGFAPGTAIERHGQYRVDFQHDADDSTRVIVVRTWLPAGGQKETLAEDVAAPMSARIVPNPDRLVWTTSACELWLLTLDSGGSPRRLWPKDDSRSTGE